MMRFVGARPFRRSVRLLAVAFVFLTAGTFGGAASAQEAPTCAVAGGTPLAGPAGCPPPTTTTTAPAATPTEPTEPTQSDETPPPVEEVVAAPASEPPADQFSASAPGAVFSPGLGVATEAVQVFDTPAGAQADSGGRGVQRPGSPTLAVSPTADEGARPAGTRVVLALLVLVVGLGYLAFRGASEIELRRAVAAGGTDS